MILSYFIVFLSLCVYNSDSSCICTEEFDPVCGEDGSVYSNKCKAMCAKTKVACTGSCPCDTDPCDCCKSGNLPDFCAYTTVNCDDCQGQGYGQGQGQSGSDSCDCCKSGDLPDFCAFTTVNCDDCQGGSDACDCCKSGDLPDFCALVDVRCEECPGYGQGQGQGGSGSFDPCDCCGANSPKQCETVRVDCQSCQKDDDDEPQFCPLHYDPICGSDGKTYGNSCQFTGAQKKTANLTQSCAGECPCVFEPCPHRCPGSNPVCGADGRTYGNPCHASCGFVPVEVKCKGKCPCEPDSDILAPCGKRCPDNFDPVCGRDGNTYLNDCHTSCLYVPVEIDCKGRCPCAPTPVCACPEIYLPVCGVNGVTYSNQCEANCEGIQCSCRGECPCRNQEVVYPPRYPMRYPSRYVNRYYAIPTRNNQNFNIVPDAFVKHLYNMRRRMGWN